MKEKTDAPHIRKFLNELLEKDWVRRTERRVWPRYAFHYTDIRNAISALKSGYLYSRTHLENTEQLSVSSGSEEILVSTDQWVKDCVRLYFRPKTPTQYWAEGVKSKSVLSTSKFPDAHCPVPVFLLFDLAQVLSLAESRFSDRGLGAHNYRILSTALELQQLEWQKIYHNTWVNMSDPNELDIIACRNAEVVVPHKLNLDALKFIYCRSVAEQETLMYLLPSEIASRYKGRIVSSPRSDFFYRQHTYLENLRLSDQNINFQFSPETRSNGPFSLTVELVSLFSGETLVRKHKDNFYVQSSSGGYNWCLHVPTDEYEVKMYLDNALIYANNHVTDSDIPF